MRNHYVGRTFIEPKQSIRHFGVKVKLNPVREVVGGKRVVLVDDSIVRGTTSRKIVKMLRDAGASEVHMRISSPPTMNPCHYGIDTPTRRELIACDRHDVEEMRAVHRGGFPRLPVDRRDARGVRPPAPVDLHGLFHRRLSRRDRGRGAREGTGARRGVRGCVGILFATAFAFRGATVIDGTGAAPRRNMLVVVTGDRITAVEPLTEQALAAVPAGAEVLNGEGLWILPGLIDAHVHSESDDDLKRMLRWGVTSVRLMAEDAGEAAAAAKNSRKRTDVPDLFPAAPIFTAAGGWFADGERTDPNLNRFPATPEEARAAVRQAARRSACPRSS